MSSDQKLGCQGHTQNDVDTHRRLLLSKNSTSGNHNSTKNKLPVSVRPSDRVAHIQLTVDNIELDSILHPLMLTHSRLHSALPLCARRAVALTRGRDNARNLGGGHGVVH